MMRSLKIFHSCLFAMMIVVFLTLLSGCEQMAINVAKNSWSKPLEEQIEANQAYLSKYPNGEYAEEAREQLDTIYIKIARRSETARDYKNYLEQSIDGEYRDEALLALAGLGQAFPNAPAYNRDGNKPFPLIVIEKYQDDMNNNNIFRYHVWNDNLPSNWAAETFYDAAFFVIVEDNLEFFDTKLYSNGKSLSGYIVQTNIIVREARTSEVLFTGMLQGSEPNFPYAIPSNKYPVIKGAPAYYISFEEWLSKTLYSNP